MDISNIIANEYINEKLEMKNLKLRDFVKIWQWLCQQYLILLSEKRKNGKNYGQRKTISGPGLVLTWQKKTFLLQRLFPVTLNYLNSKMIIYHPFSIKFFMKFHIENYSHKKKLKKKPTYKLHD